MRSVTKGLSLDEKVVAERFYGRIGEPDAVNVRNIIGVVDAHADDYFSSRELEDVAYIFRDGEAFFVIYGIGGNVTKEGERPDVDVMVVTNMRYDAGFSSYDYPIGETSLEEAFRRGNFVEPLWSSLYLNLASKMIVEREGSLPDNYNLGVTQGKCLIRLTPKNGTRKIDLVYVKSMKFHGDADSDEPGQVENITTTPSIDPKKYFFRSHAEFLTKDVGEDGASLPKVLLYYARTDDIKQLRWQW